MSKIISIVIVIAVLVFIVSAINNRSEKNDAKISDTNKVSPTLNTKATSTEAVLGIKIADGSYVQLHLADRKYILNPSEISINWTGRKIILKKWIDKGKISLKEGSFEIKSGDIVSNSFTIDMTSIVGLSTGAGSGQDKLTNHLKSADFFDVEKFPISTFIIDEIIASSTKSIYIINGKLTIKDVTNKISIPITVDTSDTKLIVIKGSVDLDRTLWNIKYGSGKFFDDLGNNVIDDMFNISFEIKSDISKYKTE
ncbi:MAG: YceI family protein [Patescibacteria group bacterium]